MEPISPYDERQYRLMLDRLQAYQDGQIELGSLVGDLEALCDALENVTQDWRNDFWQKWGKLEEVYAIALDGGRSRLEPAEVALVERAIRALREQIQPKLDQLRE